MGSRSQRISSDVPGLWEGYAAWLGRRGVAQPRFVVDGRYGMGRFEPDATLDVLLGRIRGALPSARVHVVCPGAATIRRRYARDGWLAAARPHRPESLRAIARCHVYVVGGGDLAALQTSLAGAAAEVSTRIPRVYLAVLAMRARRARSCFHSVRLSRAPIGVQRFVARRALQAADVVAACDDTSLLHLQALAERGVVRVERPALALGEESNEAAREVLRYWGARADDRPLVALVCKVGSAARSRVTAVACCVKHLVRRRGCRVVFVPFDHREDAVHCDDLSFARRVRAEVGDTEAFVLIEGAYPPPLVAALLRQAQAVVTERLDAALLADRAGIRFVAVSDDDEMGAVLRERRRLSSRVPEVHLREPGGVEWMDERLFDNGES